MVICLLWTELNLWENSYWSFNESSNFGDGFLDVRLDLFAVWNFGAEKLEKCFLHLITETVSDNYYVNTKIRMDFMSKMGRALSFHRPFIAYGNMGVLKHLKELGFRTFDKWWDEGYDDIEDYRERIGMIKELIKSIIQKSPEEKMKMWDEMQEVFQHNQSLLKNISYNEKRKVDLEIPNFFNNFKYETLEYKRMDEFNIGNLCVFYDKKFDGGGTTFGYNAITRPDILERIKNSGNVLEICSGPGFIGYTLFKRDKANKLVLSDVNKEVVPFIQKTNQYNKLSNVQFIESDCFDSISTDYKFDTIVSNPPHFKTERPGGYRSDEEKLISLDLNMGFHKKFFEQAPNYLNPGGKVILIENCEGVTEDDIRMLSHSKFGIETVDYNSYGWEGKSTFYTIILYLL
jgi:SAM-dependent methyltransferase